MTRSRRKPINKPTESFQTMSSSQSTPQPDPKPSPDPAPTGVIFLGEEDKRLLKKFNQHIINKLGLGGNRSIKL
jgi:hypothetical protein